MDIIDALVVVLSMDTKDFQKGAKQTDADLEKLKKEVQATVKEMSIQGKKAAEFFGSIKTELVGLLGAFGAATGLKEFLTSNIQGQAELGRLSQNLGISAKDLRAWGLVAEEMGGKASDAFGALQAVAGGLAEASIRGHSALTDMARVNGIQLTDARGRVLSYEDALLSISQRLKDLPRQQALYVANQLGVSSMFNELMLGPGELRKRLDAARELTRVDQSRTQAAMQLQRQWTDIRQQFREVSELAFAELSPALEHLATEMTHWMKSVHWDEGTKEIEHLWKEIDQTAEKFGGWKTAAIALGAVLGARVLSPILGLVVGLTRLVPLLGSTTAGMSLFGLAATSALHVDALGGPQRPDGSYADETPNPKRLAFTNRQLWDKVLGKPSTYPSSREMAAYELAKRSYIDPMSPDAYAKQQALILSGKVTPANVGYAAPEKDTESLSAYFSQLETKNHLPGGLLQNVENAESGGGKNLLSPKGARGPFGLMPATAAMLGLKSEDIDDVHKSAAAAAQYLGQLFSQYGDDLPKTLAAYNAGPGNVRKYGGIPPFPETQAYVAKIVQGMQGGAPTMMRAGQVDNSQRVSETHIGTINVQSSASDAQELVRDLRGALASHALVAGIDTGLD